MTERGLLADFPPKVSQQLDTIAAAAEPRQTSSFRDLRHLLWVSIDNDDSRDLDQLTFAENVHSGKDKIYVAIADVDAIVQRGSPIDRYALHNTTSVYTPTRIFPMLPPKLCYDLTSLNFECDRCAIVVEMIVDEEGKYELIAVYPAFVRNHAKLAYNRVADWLETRYSLADIESSIGTVETAGFIAACAFSNIALSRGRSDLKRLKSSPLW